MILLTTAVLLAACAPAAPAQLAPSSPPTAAPPTPVPSTPAPTETPTTLTIFAASSLTDVFEAMAETYQAEHPGTEFVFNFAASSALRTQLGEGAIADVAAFAAEMDMTLLGESGLVEPERAQIFAGNELVVAVSPGSADLVTSLEDLAKPGVKVVIAAEGVPAGDYARQVLQNLSETLGMEFAEAVLANVVSEEENVRDVLAKVDLGEADAGWVYRSDLKASPELLAIHIPLEANVRAKYPIALLTEAPDPAAAQAFIDVVMSDAGQELIEEWGFLPAPP
jgi:molybdate transport system substrate-binding protein